ncbi:MAG: 4-(cytidine 5'-diphospho)-2-C-methyl-D-erythritol kinase [Candidatus Omnitrophica bacterium]|nr:4-(cytidine 5'-diphospho)-2-C-methyl-D-erythritol kinase [Candidatus Omnitrophota bacterium]
MKILSPAKINLFLETGAVENKLHRLVSLVDIVGLYDAIEIEESCSDEVIFHSQWDIPENNTVTKSVALLKSISGIKKSVRVKIFKQIPPASGLAGGSSNAAAVLKALVKMWNIPLSAEELFRIAGRIGSDVPLFVHGKRCVIEGTGGIIRKDGIPSSPFAYRLFIPPFAVSTRDVYSRLDSVNRRGNLTEAGEKIKLLLESIECKDIDKMESLMENRLEEPYFSLWGRAREVKEATEKLTGKRLFVSGSGGTLFSVFADSTEAGKEMLPANAAGWKSLVVESIRAS